jgi:hypothetical protein
MITFQIGETAGGALRYTVMISNAPAAPFQQTLEELFHQYFVNKISLLDASQR